MVLPRRRVAAVLFAALLFAAAGKPGAAAADSPPSAEPNSFDEVTARLDRGGALYLYLSTAQWLDGLSGQLGKLRASLPTDDMTPEDRQKMDLAFKLGAEFIKGSGIEQITGVGASSLAVEPGVYRNTLFIHHGKGKETGMLNTLFGVAPHPLTALDLLPANTALASGGDYDVAGLVRAMLGAIDESGVPEFQQGKAQGLQTFQQFTGMTADEFLASLGQEIDLVLTLDPSRQIELPADSVNTSVAGLKVPFTRAALLVEVKDDRFFDKLAALAGQMPGIIKTDEPGLKMRTGSYPAAPGYELRPTVARWDKFLVLASDDSLVRDMIATRKNGGGYKASPAFAKVSAGLPDQGNSFNLTTHVFMENLRAVQRQALASQPGAPSNAQNEWLLKLLFSDAPGDSYGVTGHVEDGWLTVSKGSSGVGKVLAPLMVMPAAMAAGMAASTFHKTPDQDKAARSLAQAKQIGLACKLYAGDHDGNFPPNLEALMPTYLSNKELFVSPFAPDQADGYTYHSGLTDDSPPETILLEDNFSVDAAGQKIVVHVDNSGEIKKATDE